MCREGRALMYLPRRVQRERLLGRDYVAVHNKKSEAEPLRTLAK